MEVESGEPQLEGFSDGTHSGSISVVELKHSPEALEFWMVSLV